MKIIECPRDAIQGIKEFIPTDKKIEYINQLLKIGFDTIDFGSFVSPKIIPQLKDTAKVIEALNLQNTNTKLLSIIANFKGAQLAKEFDAIDYLGFPLSVSEVFQKANTNKTITDAIIEVERINGLAINYRKKLVVYISMAFGNPYNELYDVDLVVKLTEKLNELGVETIALSDTTGVSISKDISLLFNTLIKQYPKIEFGAHFHSRNDNWIDKIESAYNSGCRRFDSTINGYGGCPMADDKLVGNISTENLYSYLKSKGEKIDLNTEIFKNISQNFYNLIKS